MPRPPSGRLVALFGALALALGGVGARLVLLQIRDGRAYDSLAADQRVRRIALPAERGTLYDRSMHELALSLPAKAIYADPALVVDAEVTASRLAPLLDVPQARLVRAFTAPSRFEYLARRVDLDVAARIEDRGLPGISSLDEPTRRYPGGRLAAQVLGFVGLDGSGLAGLELQYEDILAGRSGEMVVEQDPDGLPIPQGLRRTVRPRRGQDLVLTIDKDIQFQAERALADAIRRNGAIGGTVIVLDPETGDVLTMATEPGFDANEFASARPEATRNRGVTDAYEPGSVNKVITAAAALEEGVISPGDRMWVEDRIQVADRVFHESHPHPPMAMTLTDVIAQSSNVGTIMTADELGSGPLDAYLRAFGFGRETGIGFPGESDGILMAVGDWWGTSMATIPIGQGIAVTPLQMASVYATIASGGLRMAPRLVRGTVGPGGTLVEVPPPAGERVVSPRTARLVTGMLAHAVDAGTGRDAQLPRYWVAGKTGTARKPLKEARGYSDQYVASFIGFAPARDPAVVVAAILDEPDTVYGGVASAPLFREVTQFALAHLRVPTGERPRIPPFVVEE
jgi:cell division protein FtsI (penicillin-binding protein 3)